MYLKIYLEFLAGQSDNSDAPLGIIANGAADKGAPNSGSLKSIYGDGSTCKFWDRYVM